MFLVGGAVAVLLNRLRVPAGTLLGAMVVSAGLHAAGLVHGRFPQPLIILGFIATGAVIGARFRGTTLRTVIRTVPGASVSILLALGVSALFAAAGAWMLALPFGQLWLAYAPGGVEAMAAMASASPARPWRAIWCPSRQVTTDEVSPGTLTRMAVVEPPYWAP